MELRVTGEPPDEPPVITVRGDKVGLGPTRKSDVERWVRWVNDLEVIRGLDILGRRDPLTLEDELEWYESNRQQAGSVTFTIYELETMQAIGNCGLANVDFRHGTATFGIMIGEKDRWGRGYGSEAARLVLDYAFNALGLHNVQLLVYANNRRAVRAYEKAGFRLVGRRREARRFPDGRVDVLIMDALPSDLPRSVVRELMTPDGPARFAPSIPRQSQEG